MSANYTERAIARNREQRREWERAWKR